MSIIADTLKRLQTQGEDPPSNPKDVPVPRPAFNKSEGSGRHRKDSPFGFLMVMVGMTITLGGLAVTAFWLGGHLDFGLATNTQARVNDHRSLPRALDLAEDPVVLEHSSENQVAAASDPSQSPQSSPILEQIDKHQASPKVDDKASLLPPPPSSSHEERTASLVEKSMSESPSTEVRVPIATPDPEKFASTINLPSGSQEESMNRSSAASGEPATVMVSPELPKELIGDSAKDIVVADQKDEGKAPDLIAMSLEEESIQTEEFVKSSKPLTDSPPEATTLAALDARRESMNHEVRATVPLQPSPAKRLRHAQQLIRSEKYEDAVALLSPLFHDPPVKWQPWFWMGTALLGKGDMEQADQFFLSGLARNDKVPQLWIQRALVAQQRGDYQLAIHELRQAESLEADIPHIHLNMGYAYERLGNDRLANQYYGKFMKLSEDQPAFFSTRKKLFARLTQQTPTKNPSPPSSPKP